MKKSAILLFTAATFAACNNNASQQTTTVDSTDEHHMMNHSQHEEHMMPETKDTTAILPNQKVFFPNLKDGQTIKLPYILKFGVEGMEVKPAAGVEANVGHHHLAVDKGPIPANTMVPMKSEAEGYYHFGKGQMQDTLQITKYPMLIPGKHTLTLQFANGLHMSYGPAMSKTVTITVK